MRMGFILNNYASLFPNYKMYVLWKQRKECEHVCFCLHKQVLMKTKNLPVIKCREQHRVPLKAGRQ